MCSAARSFAQQYEVGATVLDVSSKELGVTAGNSRHVNNTGAQDLHSTETWQMLTDAGIYFYCDKPGHIKIDCKERIRDQKERYT